MRWFYVDGVRHRTFKEFSSPEESYTDFKRIWRTYYGGFPTPADASRWTGEDRAEQWLCGVKKYY